VIAACAVLLALVMVRDMGARLAPAWSLPPQIGGPGFERAIRNVNSAGADRALGDFRKLLPIWGDGYVNFMLQGLLDGGALGLNGWNA
jgi:hypothetical protein